MLSSVTRGCRRIAAGEAHRRGAWLSLGLTIRTPTGLLKTADSILARGDENFPATGVEMLGGSDHPLIDEHGGTVGNLDTITLRIAGDFMHPQRVGWKYMPPSQERLVR